MNPAAIEWLEALTDIERWNHFRAIYSPELFSLKADHENANVVGTCWVCLGARMTGSLVVVG